VPFADITIRVLLPAGDPACAAIAMGERGQSEFQSCRAPRRAAELLPIRGAARARRAGPAVLASS